MSSICFNFCKSLRHLRRVLYADRGRLLLQTSGPVPLRPILFRTCRYFTGLCSSNIPRYFLDFALYQFLNIWYCIYTAFQCCLLYSKSKTRRRATPLLPTWIYFCRSRVTVSCALPFTTNVTISTSISQTFCSWVAIFHLRQPMVFLSHSSYGNARTFSSYECFILRAVRLSSMLFGQGYVMERLKSSLSKFYGRYGDLIKHCEVSLSQMLHDILGHDHIQWHPQLIRYYTNLQTYYQLDFITDFDLITKFWRFP